MNLIALCQGVTRPGLLLWLGIGANGLSTGCSDGGSLFEAHPGPGTPAGVVDRDTLLLGYSGGASDTLAFTLVGAQSGRLLHRLAFVLKNEDETGQRVFGMEADRRELIALVTLSRQGSTDRRELIGLALPHMELLWRVRDEEIERLAPTGVDLAFTELLGMDRSGRWLFLKAARGELEHGVLVVDRQTRQPVSFLGDFVTTKGTMIVRVAEVEAGEGGDGLLVVAGRRSPEAVRLMIYEAGDLSLRDSVFLESPLASNPRLRVMVDLLAAGDGRHVYAVTLDSLFKVDVRARVIVAKARRRRPFTFTQVAVSTDPIRLFLTDRGAPSAITGSGQLEVRDSDLGFLRDVDLRSEVTGVFNNVPFMVGIDEGERRDLLFVVSGTKSATFGTPLQKATLSVVDLAQLRLVETKRIGGFGLRAVFAF